MSWLSEWYRRTFKAEKKPKVEYVKISAISLRRKVFALCPKAYIDIPDANYALPNKEWVLYGFYNWFQELLKWWGLDYRKNWDCDNFAGQYFESAQAAYGKYKNAPTEGLAIGKIRYLIDGDREKGHAINIVVSKEGVWFFEPQSGEEKRLSSAELQSAWLVLF